MNTRASLVSLVFAGCLSAAAPGQTFDTSIFIVYTPGVQGPSYPTGTAGTHIIDEPTLAPIADFGMGLRSVSLNGLPPGEPVLGAIQPLDGDTGPTGRHINSFFDVFVDIQAAPPGQFVDSFFDIFTQLSVPGEPAGTTYPIIRVDVPLVHDSFFDIFVEVQLPTGILPLQLHGQAAPGVRFNPGTQAGFMPDSFFDVFVDITFDRSIFNQGGPAMRLTVDGTIPAPGAAALLSIGGLVLVRRKR